MNAPLKTTKGWNLHSVVEATFAAPLVSTRPSGQATVLNLLDETPRVELSHIRLLADLLGFVVVPFECLDPRSYEQESEDTRRAIHAFVSVLEPWFDSYVLCPIGHYSLQKHFKMETDRPVYVPDAWRQTFITIEMLLPVLRGLDNKVESLTKRVDDLGRQIERAAEQARRNRLQASDPLLFAVPKGFSVGDDGLALIGPAWGPDMDPLLLKTFKLEEKPGQRQHIEASRKTLLQLNPKGELSDELPPDHFCAMVRYDTRSLVNALVDSGRSAFQNPKFELHYSRKDLPTKGGMKTFWLRPLDKEPQPLDAILHAAIAAGYVPALPTELLDYCRSFPELQIETQIVGYGAVLIGEWSGEVRVYVIAAAEMNGARNRSERCLKTKNADHMKGQGLVSESHLDRLLFVRRDSL